MRRLELTRAQILAYRRHVMGLDARLPNGRSALQQIAWAGLQDSMPRAALLSIHARMAGTQPDSWENPELVQVWGPRYNVYVVAKQDLAIFTLGRLPAQPKPLQRAQDIATRLRDVLGDERMQMGAAAKAIGASHSNSLRYAAPTGTLLIRWDGARQPDIWSVPPPEIDPFAARCELARRYLHVFGPTTPAAFAKWAGIRLATSAATFEALQPELTPARTPIGDGWILSQDESLFHQDPQPAAPARLLPSGDTWYLLYEADREFLLPDESQRNALWTSRVWPGALLVNGKTVGTWRRAGHVITLQPWEPLSPAQQTALEVEAAALPLPGIERDIEIRWDSLG